MHHIGAQLRANAYQKHDGSWTIRQPGDPNWVNAFGTTEESYIDLFEDIINRIDNPLAFRNYDEKKIDRMVKQTYQKAINLIQEKA